MYTCKEHERGCVLFAIKGCEHAMMGRRIREMRLEAGLTQTQLAKDIVTPSMISQIEAGKAQPSPNLLQKLAERLGVAPETLEIDRTADTMLQTRLRVMRICSAQGLHEEAMRLADELEAQSASPHWETEYVRAKAHMAACRFKEALASLRKAARLLPDRPNSQVLPELLMLQGDVFAELCDYDIAFHLYEQASLALADVRPFRALLEVDICSRLSVACDRLGQFDRARDYAERAAARLALSEAVRLRARETAMQAGQLLASGQDGAAGQLADEAQAMTDTLDWLEASLDATLALADEALRRGEVDEAEVRLADCRKRSQAYTTQAITARMRHLESELWLSRGDRERARAGALAVLTESADFPAERARSFLTSARRWQEIGDLELAERYALAARQCISDGKSPLFAQTVLRLAEIHLARGDFKMAQHLLEADRTAGPTVGR